MVNNYKEENQSLSERITYLEEHANSTLDLIEFDILELELEDRAAIAKSHVLIDEDSTSTMTTDGGNKVIKGVSAAEDTEIEKDDRDKEKLRSLLTTGGFKPKQNLLIPKLATRFKDQQGFTPGSILGTGLTEEDSTPASMTGMSSPTEAVDVDSKPKEKPTDLLSPESMEE
jgi:hypothetical protein